MIKKLEAVSEIIYKISSVVIGLLLGIITVLVTVQVVSRFIFSFSIDFAQEFIVFALVWLIFIGTSMGVKEGSLITVTIVIEKLPKKPLLILDMISKSILIAFFIITIIYNIPVIEFGKVIKLPTIKIPYSYQLWSYSVSAAIMAYYLMVDLLKCIAGLRTKTPADKGAE